MKHSHSYNNENHNAHHWMLWISPDQAQINQLKSWPEPLKERVLTLTPRHPKKLAETLVRTIETGYYAMITLPKDSLCEIDEWRVKQSASNNNTIITWNE